MIGTGRLPAKRWKEYRELRLEALRSDPLAFGGAYEDEKDYKPAVWKSRIGSMIFALESNKLIGMISCVFEKGIKTKHVVSLHSFYVNKGYRGRHVGDMLLSKTLSLIGKRKGIAKVELDVNTAQRSAIKLYTKKGFVIIGRQHKEMKVGNKFYDEFLMEKLL